MKEVIEAYLHDKSNREVNVSEVLRMRDSAQAIDDEAMLLTMADTMDNLQHYVETLTERVSALEGGPLMPRQED